MVRITDRLWYKKLNPSQGLSHSSIALPCCDTCRQLLPPSTSTQDRHLLARAAQANRLPWRSAPYPNRLRDSVWAGPGIERIMAQPSHNYLAVCDRAFHIGISMGGDEIRLRTLYSRPYHLRQSTLCVLPSELLRIRRLHRIHILHPFLLSGRSRDDTCTSWYWLDPGRHVRRRGNPLGRHHT